MNRGVYKKLTALLTVGAVVLFYTPSILMAKENGIAELKGTVFAADGTTPMQGAVITVKNIANEAFYSSEKTNETGQFEIPNMVKGIYIMGVKTSEGEFNTSNLIGVRSGKTEKVTLALETFDTKTQEATQEMLQDQRRDGESLIGKVESYDPETSIAMVYIMKGYLQKDDRIHNLYPPQETSETDFYQKVDVLQFEGQAVERVFAGQTVAIKMKETVVPGDLVYVSCKQGILPLFLSPLGIAAILAGSGIIYGFVDPLDDPPTVTGFKK